MSTPHAGEQSGAGRIVVGVDGSPSSEAALRWAVGQARLTGRPVHAVYAWNYPLYSAVDGVDVVDRFDWEGDSVVILREAVSRTVDAADGVDVVQRVLQGHAAGVLLDTTQDTDLLVVGSHGHGGFAGMLLGSVSHSVIAHARCPVVVVPARPPLPDG